ncbi:23S rRNA (pseudouridine(1915)-N(3))-methyltransferase RlmH [Candidatus Peregrinibacteria bacterium]|nr:23S rRNA (pseudouridine(1915)-N(3))-methyltransferase RlmH [Candidatus Peregrinibacteria bacterium]
MHITLLCVGTLKTPWIIAGCTEYLRRIAHDGRLTAIEVPASKQKDPVKQQAEESVALLKKLEKTAGEVWVLDERGKAMTSQVFSDALGVAADHGTSVTFVIGGAYGLTDAVREHADRIVRLSEMTLPHELCRLVFLEQLYRALQIRKGTGYHH